MHTPGVYRKHSAEISFSSCSKNLPYTSTTTSRSVPGIAERNGCKQVKAKKKKKNSFTEELNHLKTTESLTTY